MRKFLTYTAQQGFRDFSLEEKRFSSFKVHVKYPLVLIAQLAPHQSCSNPAWCSCQWCKDPNNLCSICTHHHSPPYSCTLYTCQLSLGFLFRETKRKFKEYIIIGSYDKRTCSLNFKSLSKLILKLAITIWFRSLTTSFNGHWYHKVNVSIKNLKWPKIH